MSCEFLVLTYNVGNGRANPDKLTEMIRRSGADIVGLQELSDSQAEAIEKCLKGDFPHQSLFPGGFAGKGILSRHTITGASQAHLGPERPDLKASITIGDFEVTVISAHPPPPKFQKTAVKFDAYTLAQIEALANLAMEHPPAILMGDFNFVSRSNEYRLICSKGLRDAYHESGRGAGFTLPRRIGPWRRMQWLNRLLKWIPLVPVARVDYIWYTNSLNCLACWVGEDAGSDHLPVLAKMNFS
jgi:vancomycin resistance protein VanJ